MIGKPLQITDAELDKVISDLEAAGLDTPEVTLLHCATVELRDRRAGWGARLAALARFLMPRLSVMMWCRVISALTFLAGGWATVAMPDRLLGAILGGVSVMFLALGLLLVPQDFSRSSRDRGSVSS